MRASIECNPSIVISSNVAIARRPMGGRWSSNDSGAFSRRSISDNPSSCFLKGQYNHQRVDNRSTVVTLENIRVCNAPKPPGRQASKPPSNPAIVAA